MSSVKGKLTRLLGGMFLRSATIASAEEVGTFRRLVLRADVPTARAGTKLQILLPSDDVRTYSPIATQGGIALLGWKHAGGPGAEWMSNAKVGEEVRFVGPQRSLELAAGAVILVGDETSVAVASAFEAERPGQVQAVFQARAVDDIRAAAQALGLQGIAVVPNGATDAVVSAVLAAREALPNATLALTGGSELVVAVRTALRARGIRDVKTKPYWIPGRAGLD